MKYSTLTLLYSHFLFRSHHHKAEMSRLPSAQQHTLEAIHREIHIFCNSIMMPYVTKLLQHSNHYHIIFAQQVNLSLLNAYSSSILCPEFVSLTYSSNNGSLLPLKCTAHQTEYICCCFFLLLYAEFSFPVTARKTLL